MTEYSYNSSQPGPSVLSNNATFGLFLFMIIVGVPANAFVLAVSLLDPFKRSVSSVYIGSLACADLLLLSMLPFWASEVVLRDWRLGSALCHFCSFCDLYSFFTSVFSLTVISVDRYVAVVWPIAALRWRTTTRARVVAVAVWLFAGLPTMLTKFYHRTIYDASVYHIFVLPRMPLFLGYIHSFIHSFISSNSSATYWYHLYVKYAYPTLCLGYLNSCINPFLYAFVGRHFRKSFKSLQQKHCPCRINGNTSQNTSS
uniref:type-1 angiotensin II receptor A-like n=1 Tax=Myxine glutinosa TaxID=7769 RepID=UPI00358F7D2B